MAPDEDFPHHHSAADEEVEVAAYCRQEAVQALCRLASCVVAGSTSLASISWALHASVIRLIR